MIQTTKAGIYHLKYQQQTLVHFTNNDKILHLLVDRVTPLQWLEQTTAFQEPEDLSFGRVLSIQEPIILQRLP
jgi:hypothetical protein